MCYGVILALEAVTLFMPSNSSSGDIPLDVYYRLPEGAFHFPYPGFEWLPLLPPVWMNVLAVTMGLGGLAMAAGLIYRFSAVLGFTCWMYFYLVESTRTYWMSHYYLMSIIGLMMCLMPAARKWSLDEKIFKKKDDADGLVPLWTLGILRIQLVITYFYAGLAKVNADWLLDFQPVGYFLSQPHIGELPGVISSALSTKAAAGIISWAGALFDLLIGFVLLVPKWRKIGMILMVGFHSMNHFLLFRDIGWFPLLGILSALIFFAPDWPARFLSYFGWVKINVSKAPKELPVSRNRLNPIVYAFICAWIFFQVIIPLRHLAIPGDARFTFEGLAFSWRLKAEVYRSMPAELHVVDRDLVTSSDDKYLLNWDNWPGEKIIYRQLPDEDINWNQLPPILIIEEPIVGQRILLNPMGLHESVGDGTLRQSLAILYEFWENSYGRKPDKVELTLSTDKLIEGWRSARTIKSLETTNSDSLILSQIIAKHGPTGDSRMMPLISRLHPFALNGRKPPEKQMIIVYDDNLIKSDENSISTVLTEKWINGPLTRSPHDEKYDDSNGFPPIIHIGSTSPLNIRNLKISGPTLTDYTAKPDLPPSILWNYLEDLNVSKAMHMGTQPFLLREYCRHIASTDAYLKGRPVEIFAETFVSMNGRPFQPIVDPETNLAKAPLKIMGHHDWIYNLKYKRIPKNNRLPGFYLK